ncbi:MAG: tetratricopeptide repeat protein [Bacteroidales bacterium]|jgi:tetratricopeptide (TPR) repeat protein|nr:tetratricopeptide repeat protein [Bacteroidales bacterium]
MKRFFSVFSMLLLLNSFVYAQSRDLESLVNLGNDFIKLNDYKSALEKFEDALQTLPTYAPALDGKARVLILMEDYRQAEKTINQAIEFNSDYAPFYLTRGKAYFHRGKLKDALNDFNRGIDLLPNQNNKELRSDFFVNRGATHQKLLNFDQALEDYSKTIQINPENPNTYLYRGALYYENQDYNEAMDDFSKVIRIDPQNPFAFYNRGMIYLKLQEEDKACEDFHKACELGNTNACKMVVSRCIDL